MEPESLEPELRDLDRAVAEFRQMPVPPAPANDTLLAQLTAGTSPAVESLVLLRRRQLMRLMKWSGAAAAVAAVCGVLTLGGRPSVAMADVIKAAAKHNIVRYSLMETSESGDTKGTASTICYADLKSPRTRWDREPILTFNGAVESSSFQVWDFAKNRHLVVTSETATKAANDPNLDDRIKQALQGLNLPRNDAMITTAANDFKKTLLESLHELEQHRDATSAPDKVGRRDAIKYTIEDGNKTTTLWVDTKTKLPLRMEFEIIDASPQCQRLHMLFTDFEWDPKLKGFSTSDEFFSTVPPAGFRVTDRMRGAK